MARAPTIVRAMNQQVIIDTGVLATRRGHPVEIGACICACFLLVLTNDNHPYFHSAQLGQVIGLLEQAAFAFAESNLTGDTDDQTFANGEIGNPASLPCGHDHLRGIGCRSSCGTEPGSNAR